MLKNVLQTFTSAMTVDSLRFMLEQVLTIMVGNNRSEVDAAINFLLLYIKILPVPLVTNDLPLIVSIDYASQIAGMVKGFIFEPWSLLMMRLF